MHIEYTKVYYTYNLVHFFSKYQMKYVFKTWIIPERKLPVMSQVSHLENIPKRISRR